MGRKHKRNSVKYIKQSNENLRQENENLKQITNYTMAQNIEIQNKVTTLENYNYGLIKILEIQKEANDFQQQKIEIMESQLSILNEQVANGSTLPFVQQKDYEKSEFGRALALACSIKILKIISFL
ncbi:hypothetical protein RclHR1_17060005 [Rhizophagus clarus]|uniref:Uncharacterized protein n=1 Tax=Rhizophagus clarus TaxID=94130 RepID=A0A2Z6QZQ7_9GLOM|nr:hypothetical protein RclHR1_17060005 [Rhizophagus clarus]GES92030.1 hypothetical protein GLOIN_2v1785408 [Rhizophagus clarus]